jgi:hypothetical protein
MRNTWAALHRNPYQKKKRCSGGKMMMILITIIPKWTDIKVLSKLGMKTCDSCKKCYKRRDL